MTFVRSPVDFGFWVLQSWDELHLVFPGGEVCLDRENPCWQERGVEAFKTNEL